MKCLFRTVIHITITINICNVLYYYIKSNNFELVLWLRQNVMAETVLWVQALVRAHDTRSRTATMGSGELRE